MICLITQNELSYLKARRLIIDPLVKTLVFTSCSPYEYPVYNDTKESIVFPEIQTVVFWRNEKYFSDKWCFGNVFPNTKQIFLNNVCGGFFDFVRPKVQYIVPLNRVKYVGFPLESTHTLPSEEKWDEAVRAMGSYPKDLYCRNGEFNEKYIGKNGLNKFCKATLI